MSIISKTDTWRTACSTFDNVEKEWRAVLIEGQCQSGKTFCVNNLLKEKIKNKSGTLVLIITQANNNSSAIQTLERAQNDLTSIVDIDNMSRSVDAPCEKDPSDNYLLVDFWHSRNMERMMECAKKFKRVVVVIDEADQGGDIGISSRILFMRDLENNVPDCKLFLVTATTANLSRAILKMSESDHIGFNRGSLVHEILFEHVVEYHNVKPSDNYVGTSRIVNGDVRYLKFKAKSDMLDGEDYNKYKTNTIIASINQLPTKNKELTLIATSSRVKEHKDMVQPLINCGYNVVVEMNGNNIRNYEVSYLSEGILKSWKIPTKEIHQIADDGGLASYFSEEDGRVDTGVTRKENCSLPDILQAALFMGTETRKRIRQNVSKRTYAKLSAMYLAIQSSMKKLNRPSDYPSKPQVAIIVGNLASRGITFQDPYIDLICTSFVFTDLQDSMERGARSTQRFGRACGNLFYAYKDDRKPIIIATEKIVESALANYNAVYEKSKNIKNGELIALRHYITGDEWKEFKKRARITIKLMTKHNTITKENGMDTRYEGVNINKLKSYMKSDLVVGKIVCYLLEHTRDGNYVMITNLERDIGYDGCNINSNIDNGRGKTCKYGKLWVVKNGMIRINQNILQFI